MNRRAALKTAVAATAGAPLLRSGRRLGQGVGADVPPASADTIYVHPASGVSPIPTA